MIMLKNKCPLPKIYDILDKLQLVNYFTELDFK